MPHTSDYDIELIAKEPYMALLATSLSLEKEEEKREIVGSRKLEVRGGMEKGKRRSPVPRPLRARAKDFEVSFFAS